MRAFKLFLSNLIIIGLLTLFTQIGGIIWLICLPLFFWINGRFGKRYKRILSKFALYSVVYLFTTFVIVPPLAYKQCGRVPLQIWSHPNLKPHSVFYYCLLNHHYVRPELKKLAEEKADRLAEKYPGSVLVYLDANFPFIDGYPLEPHFSHRDGKKLDLAFHWKNKKKESRIFGTPSWYGYGACALPKPGEKDMEPICRKKGNWYRSLDRYLAVVFYNEEKYELDEEVTREMIRLFAADKRTGKILLEPHLETRLRLSKYDKIRFQGCHAARHDDHIHLQL